MLLMRLEANHNYIGDINSSTVQHGPLLRAPEQYIVPETSTKTTLIPPNGPMKGYEHHQPCPHKMQVAQAKRWNTPGASQHNGTTQAAHQLQRRSIRPSMCIPPSNIPVPSHPRLQYRDTLNHAEAKAYTCPYPGLKHGSPWSGACVPPGELPATRRPVQAYQMQQRRSLGVHPDLECSTGIPHHEKEPTYNPESP